MAINKDETSNVITEITHKIRSISEELNLPRSLQERLKTMLYGPAFQEIEEIVEQSRPPRMYLVGRSGHGKSSLVNALANRHVAEVGDVKPTTAASVRYEIRFEEQFAAWQVMDSRGIFETTAPLGASKASAAEQLLHDIREFNPDIILHVVAAPEIRTLENDLKFFETILKAVQEKAGIAPHVVIVLGKIDLLGNPRDWPPETSERKRSLIREALDYMAHDVLKLEATPLDEGEPIRGFRLKSEVYVGLLPVSSLEGDLWNIEELSAFIGGYLPKSAILNFYQAQKRKGLLKMISTALIKRFSAIAFTVGLSPIPLLDLVLLTPLQLLMIVYIGGLSCRSFSRTTAAEFLSAGGLSAAASVGLRYLLETVYKAVPILGTGISSSIAAGTTYGIGKVAEAYFFFGEKKTLEDFEDEFKARILSQLPGLAK